GYDILRLGTHQATRLPNWRRRVEGHLDARRRRSGEISNRCSPQEVVHPEFEADHFNGLSVWRGLFKKSSGTISMDKEAGTGAVNVEIATASIDFGHDKLNEHASSPDMFDVA